MSAWDLAGHSAAAAALRADIASGRTAHAYLFAGPAGTIKRALADVFMRALHCESAGEKPCDQCPACRRHLAGDHPDAHVLESSKATVGVDEVRSLISAISIRPMLSDRHLALIPDAAKLTPQAQNALLKTLEEPTGQVVFILLAQSPRDVLPTVASRVRTVRFALPEPEEAERALISGGVQADRARLLSRLTAGDVDEARRLDGDKDYWALRERVKKALLSLDGPASAPAAARLLKDDKDKAPALLESVARDAMLWGDAPDGARNGDMLQTIEKYAPRGQEFLEGVMRLKMRLASNVAYLNALECLFMDISGGNNVWQR